MTELTARRRALPPGSHRPHRPDGGVPVLARPLHRQHRLPEHLGQLPRGEPQLALVGAQRLHDRVRRRAGARRPLGRPGRAQEGLPPRPGRLHLLLRALRASRRRSGSWSPPASCRRRAARSCSPRRSGCSSPPSVPSARAPPSGCGRPSAERPPPSGPRSAGSWCRSAGAGCSWSTCPSACWRSSSGSACCARCATRRPTRPTCSVPGCSRSRWPASWPPSSRDRTGAGSARGSSARSPWPPCRAPGSSCARSATPTRSSSRP